jgi:hypothetical protein
MKDLVIGGASNYTWDQLKYWVNSIKKSGFSGDIVLVATNISKVTIEKLIQEGVKLSLYGKQQENGDFVAHSNGAPHVERFFYIWNFLETINQQYRYVISTDTRDVVFQKNPSEWLEDNLMTHFLVASSEGMRYKNETWGNQNLYDTFGPFFHNHFKNNMIFNVGTIAGDYDYVKSLMFMIFQMSINRPIPIVDQSVYNVLLNTTPWLDDTMMASNSDAWAIQLGTTLHAVKAGKGDLGLMFKNDPGKYERIYEDQQPIIEENVVKNVEGNLFTIIHQYDRVPSLKEHIEKIYGD